MEEINGVVEIIKKNRYLTLGTTSKQLVPWVSPLFFAVDEDITFYWFSAKDSRHSQNLKGNSKSSIAIFDSSVALGDGDAVFFEGNSFELSKIEMVSTAVKLLNRRFDIDGFTFPEPKLLLGLSINRAYKFVPDVCYSLTDLTIKDSFVTRRIEFAIEDVKKALAVRE